PRGRDSRAAQGHRRADGLEERVPVPGPVATQGHRRPRFQRPLHPGAGRAPLAGHPRARDADRALLCAGRDDAAASRERGALREREERDASTVELAAIGISHIGVDGRFVHVNRQLCEMLGYTREELLELSFRDVSHPEDRHVTDKDRARLYAGEIDSLQAEKRYLRKDGTPVWVRINAALKRHPDGSPMYDISIVEDISERKRAEQRVQYLASHDEMTNLPNRAMFTELLDRAIASAQRARRKLAV